VRATFQIITRPGVETDVRGDGDDVATARGGIRNYPSASRKLRRAGKGNRVTAFGSAKGIVMRFVAIKHGGSNGNDLNDHGRAILLYATGIYNPPVVHHGRCIAEPGTFNALFCMGRTEAPPVKKYRAR
jgi:hypothetical protein